MFKSIGLIVLGFLAFCGTAEVNTTEEVPSTDTIAQAEDTPAIAENEVPALGIDELDLPPVDITDPNAKELTWTTLADVEYKEVHLEDLDAYFWEPIFGEGIKGYEGQQVYITGYMVPVDVDANYFVLSRYPFASCFFCGNAGPESVVDLRLIDEDRKFIQDERLTFAGKLRLNSSDVYELNYILESAEENK